MRDADYLLMLLTGAGGEPPGVWEDGANWYQPYGSSRPGGNAYAIEYSGEVTETISQTAWTLTAETSSIQDPDGNGVFQYQWQSSANGIDDWTDILGATSQTYDAASGDAGLFFRASVSYVDGGGFGEVMVTDPVQPIGPEPPPDGLIELDGRYYQIVEDFNVTRDEALRLAEASSFELNGVTYNGHLGTITSAAEEALIEGAILGGNGDSYFSREPAAFWLGGEYVSGQWTWTSGPEDGQALSFTDWDTDSGGQEAGQGTAEPYLVLNMFARSDINAVWYSYDAGDTYYVRGYVTEFEPSVSDMSGVLDVVV